VSFEADRRRLIIALALTGVCGLVALAAGIGALVWGVSWLNWVFGGALIGGFAAQFWFMWAFLKGRPSA
jgi:hypothetical protein